MRQIGTLAHEDHARRFEDYLLAQGIRSQVDEGDDGWAVWIHDEDHVPRAREELAKFEAAPDDARYASAAPAADTVRQEARQREAEYRRNRVDIRRRWNRPGWQQAPVTAVLIAASIFVAVATQLGERPEPVLTKLFIASVEYDGDYVYWNHLEAIRHGQIWRLVTPAIIHFGILHILFNMSMLYQFGRILEGLLGSVRFAIMVLLIAVTSNVAEYYVDLSFDTLALDPSPLFGGMSGVNYGLFGYIWMKSKFDPWVGISIDPTSVFIFIGWFFLCLFEAVGPIANVAHGVGLLVGVAVGYTPVLWRRVRRR